MPRTLRYTLVSLREILLSAGPFVLLAAGLLALAYWWLDPAPPRRVVLATGPAQSAYEAFGQRYRQALAADGIEVVLLPSEGASANLQLLRAGRADLGFVQGGSGETAGADPDAGPGLVSLGALFLEPVWVFHRVAAPPQGAADTPPHRDAGRARERVDTLAELQALRINVGTAGSGVPSLMDKLFEANRIEPAALRLSRLGQTPATVAFLQGELDALVFASAPESLMVQMLLQTPGVGLLDFAQSDAYSRRFPFLAAVRLPRGVADLARDLPPHEVRLVATTTSLLAREGTHPALLQLFAQAARRLHGGAGWFQRAGEFPNLEGGEYPVAREAERAIRSGTPLLQRYLPFWLANLVERMWLALGLIVAILLPLSRIVPPLYEFRIRSRVFRWYGQLRELEERLQSDPAQAAELRRELDALEAKVERVSVPLSYADELYALRSHIAMVRTRLGHAA